MEFIKKHKIIFLGLLIIIILPLTITFSRYVYSKVVDYILEKKKFYFNSDKLTKDGKIYEINNWSGTDPFNIEFDLNNRKNNLLYSDSDIEYELNVECEEDTLCSITNKNGFKDPWYNLPKLKRDFLFFLIRKNKKYFIIN